MGVNDLRSREALLHEFALRLLTRHNKRGQLLVGQLPDDLPVELPLPVDCVLVGSLAEAQIEPTVLPDTSLNLGTTAQQDLVQQHLDQWRKDYGGWREVTVLLDVPVSPANVLAFYRQHLMEWPETPIAERAHGFVAQAVDIVDSDTSVQALFYWSEDGPMLGVKAVSNENGPTEVCLEIHADIFWQPQHRRTARRVFVRIPTLLAPPRSVQRLSSSSHGSSPRATHAVILETPLDLIAVNAHYQRQLEEGGWQRTSDERDGLLAWSNWRVPADGNTYWHGAFHVLHRLWDGYYELEVEVMATSG